MTVSLTGEDRQKIRGAILEKYARVAENPEGLFGYPTGIRGLEALEYDEAIIGSLPNETLEFFCGVGNPFSVGTIPEGSIILDVGCGAGIDAMVAAKMTGQNGHVTGIDLSLNMLQRARLSVSLANLENVSFERALAEDLPFADNSFDVVISSGALNLVPNKKQTLNEIFRVMKKGARLMIADQALTASLSDDTNRVDNWAK